MRIVSTINSFYKQIDSDEYHRFKSWEHCYMHFKDKKSMNLDVSALNMGFYLASWGMYRGSSFLLWKDYKIHEGLIDQLIKSKEELFNLDITKEENDIRNYQIIYSYYIIVKDYFSSKVIKVNGKIRDIEASDTLTSKVLLGFCGCIPAFDRYFILGIKKHSISSKIFSDKLYYELAAFYRKYKLSFDKAQNNILRKCGIVYPPMKLLDMYFWEIGKHEEEKKKKKGKNTKYLTTVST